MNARVANPVDSAYRRVQNGGRTNAADAKGASAPASIALKGTTPAINPPGVQSILYCTPVMMDP